MIHLQLFLPTVYSPVVLYKGGRKEGSIETLKWQL